MKGTTKIKFKKLKKEINGFREICRLNGEPMKEGAVYHLDPIANTLLCFCEGIMDIIEEECE